MSNKKSKLPILLSYCHGNIYIGRVYYAQSPKDTVFKNLKITKLEDKNSRLSKTSFFLKSKQFKSPIFIYEIALFTTKVDSLIFLHAK